MKTQLIFRPIRAVSHVFLFLLSCEKDVCVSSVSETSESSETIMTLEADDLLSKASLNGDMLDYEDRETFSVRFL